MKVSGQSSLDNPLNGDAAALSGHISDDIEVGVACVSPAGSGLLSGVPEAEDALPNPTGRHLSAPDRQPASPGLCAGCMQSLGVAAALDRARQELTKVTNALGVQLGALWAKRAVRIGSAAVAAVGSLVLFFVHFLGDTRRIIALFGMVTILSCCATTFDKTSMKPRLRDGVMLSRAASSLSLQLIFGVLIAYTPMYSVFFFLGQQVNVMLGFCQVGSDFVFASASVHGNQPTLSALNLTAVNITTPVYDDHGHLIPAESVTQHVLSGDSFLEGTMIENLRPNFALMVLPSIIFFSALVELANHWGLLGICMRAFATVFCTFTRCTPPEAVSAAANVFVGMTNAPLLIKPFLEVATPSHLCAIMAAGYGTAGASMLPVYISMGAPPVHLLAAAWMGAPASLTCSKLLCPDSPPRPDLDVSIDAVRPPKCASALEAIARGTNDGLQISLGVASVLISFIGLMAMADGILGWCCALFGLQVVTLDTVVGVLLTPVALLLGVKTEDAGACGMLLGQKTFLNEFVAFQSLSNMQAGQHPDFEALSPRSLNIITYALCGFSNIGSIGMTISALNSVVETPAQQDHIGRLALRALLAGVSANLLNAALVGVLI